MNLVAWLDSITFLAAAVALIFLLTGRKGLRGSEIRLLLAVLFCFNLFYAFCLWVEWVGISQALDPYEDYAGALMPMLWGFIFYAFVQRAFILDLRRSEENYRVTLDSIGDGVIAATRQGNVVRMNPTAEQLTGWKLEEARGRALAEVFRITSGQTGEPAENPVDKVIASGQVVGLANHTVLTSRDGRQRQIADSGAPIKDRAGRITGVVLVFRDVTEPYRMQEALRENERFLRNVFDSIQDGLSVLDRDLNIVRVNKWMEQMYAPQAPLVGRKCYTAYQARETVCPCCPSIQALATGNAHRTEVPYPSAEMPEGWIDLSAFPIKDQNGRVSGVIEYVKDISDRKKAEQSLVKARDELARYAAELERSNLELEDFSYIASHDLKEPLRGIHNYSSFLLEDYGDKLDAEGQAKLQTLMRLTRRLESLLDDLLHYSRVGRIELVMRPADPGELVREVLETMENMLEEHQVRIAIADDMPPVVCDRASVGEVFRNLITNAVKYNDNKTKQVDIGWQAAEDDERVTLFVRDNGIGIPDKHLDKVFKIFKRLHVQEKYGGGTGAGLTLARRIIERHGGTLKVKSESGRGSTFLFTLPRGDRPCVIQPIS